MRRTALTPLLSALCAFSVVPGAHAYCYIDGFGRERCTLSTGTRIGIAIAAFASLAILLAVFRSMRQRNARRTNLQYINTSAVAGSVPPGPPPPGYPPPGGYPVNGYGGPAQYQPNNGYSPQYPAQAYNPYPSPQPPPPGNFPDYAPPAGPPPGNSPPYYAPPPGPPPASDQKQAF